MNKEKETLLVCLSSSPSSKTVIQAGAEMARALKLPWTAIYVRAESFIKLSDSDKQTLQNNMNLVEFLGGTIVTVRGKSIADEIVGYMHQRHVNHLVIGRKKPSRLGRLFPFGKAIVDEISRACPDVTVHIIPDSMRSPKGDYKPKRTTVRSRRKNRISLKPVLLTLVILTVPLGVGFIFYATTGFNDANIIMIFLLAVLFVSISAGRVLGLASSILSVLLFNFLFTEPRFTFVVYETQYFITFPVMLIVSLTASELTVRLKRESVNAAVRERRTEFLYNVSRRLMKTLGEEEIILTVAQFLEEFMKQRIVCLLTDECGKLDLFYPKDKAAAMTAVETRAAQWVFTHNISAGHGTDIMSDARGFYVPLSRRNMPFGVIGIYNDGRKEDIESNQRSLLEAVGAQLSVAIDRERLYKEQEKIRIEIEREKMHSNLLRSISHDLRTPLAAIAGASSTLLSENSNIKGKDRSRLLTDIVNDATWLTQLVENLLSLTRAEEGQLGLSKEWEVVEEVVLSAVERIKNRVSCHQITTLLPEEPFIAPMDTALIQQVLTNLLDNALRYTPENTAIIVRTISNRHEVIFEVEDNGPGIPGDSLLKIFDRFVTVQENGGNDRRGLGLGLTICKSIVEAHNGTISAENISPHGTIFRFSLPIPRLPEGVNRNEL